MNPGDRLRLRPDPDEGWALGEEAPAVPLARIVFARGLGWTARPERGPAWRVNAYGRGWKLVADPLDGGDPLLWYTGRLVRSGGEVELPDGRTYDVRSRPLHRLDLHLRDGDGRLLLEGHGEPGGPLGEFEATLDLVDEPAQSADRDLLLLFMAVMMLLVRQNSGGGSGGGGGGF